LDADIMVLKSIAPLFEMEIHDSGVAGVIEPGIRTIGADFQPGCPFSVNLEAPYFNAGFLVLDMIKIKKNGLFDRAFSILNQYPEFCKIWDQSPLNYVVNGCFTVLDSDHNFQNSRYYQSPVGFIDPLKNRSMNIHFIAPKCKPWQKYSPHPADTMFRMLLDEIYPEWRTREFKESELKNRLRMSFAHLHPFLFRARAILKRMLGKDFRSDLWAAQNWKVFSDDLRESKKRRWEFENLYKGWQSQIRSRLV
jgi:lipopolysaccharide biosynthesis glycosyltransferase